ncbi:hypothetical protein G7K_2556-t1 [Saitoella complicata NRRL Y-17804]|uniref:Uncharacterized protein n=1 Tax=Saitoella complicata (strain BCRC 22490 / CBS 7301 / JCM 7358 / NBRC 10748 / NRRL Y-17804) TaxID=698492 RepID=A0A0E9NF01_SAICN|nr:hypothetical protein G7K_2556-t1 [Saitoella complicata NRRL Y-17804]
MFRGIFRCSPVPTLSAVREVTVACNYPGRSGKGATIMIYGNDNKGSITFHAKGEVLGDFAMYGGLHISGVEVGGMAVQGRRARHFKDEYATYNQREYEWGNAASFALSLNTYIMPLCRVAIGGELSCLFGRSIWSAWEMTGNYWILSQGALEIAYVVKIIDVKGPQPRLRRYTHTCAGPLLNEVSASCIRGEVPMSQGTSKHPAWLSLIRRHGDFLRGPARNRVTARSDIESLPGSHCGTVHAEDSK